MKTKYPSMFGVLAALLLVASFVVPTSFTSPTAVEASPGICKWDTLREPGSLAGTWVIAAGTEPHDIAVGNDGRTIVVTLRAYLPPLSLSTNLFIYSSNGGIFWSWTRWNALTRDPAWPAGAQVYHVAIAPDNPSVWAVTTDAAALAGPQEVWITENAGSSWEVTNLANVIDTGPPAETIRCIDISVDYGGTRDIAVGTADGFGGGDVYVLKSTGFTGWVDQGFDDVPMGVDFFAVKFSPTYAGDAALAVVYADDNQTFYNISQRDIDQNAHSSWAFSLPGIEVKDPAAPADASPGYNELNKADLELPSDFSGTAASLRRAYISLDAYGNKADDTIEDGIYRVDDSVVYTLLDTTTIADKSIYSIAYFGTYASGKLLAGERMGYPCTATVPTWFTDSPTVCPIPCWYPALKPTTGAACGAAPTCAVGAKDGVGAAVVAWNVNGTLAYAITGCQAIVATTALVDWFDPWLDDVCCFDESAFAISRNNGETWNQLSLIDTLISQFTDIAPSPDCATVYLASVNITDNATCCGFDSVWRTSTNPTVTSPLPTLPLGTYWERVFTHVTAPDCEDVQTDLALLRVVPFCDDPEGMIVGWAAWNTTAQAWSPDFGDYWADVNPRNPIQDFCFESRTVLYNLSPNGLVQKMPYTGTAWSTTLRDVDSYAAVAHTIAAYPEGHVLVGWGAPAHAAAYAVSYCGNFTTDEPVFSTQVLAGQTPYMGNVHVAFHPDFANNSTYFIADDDATVGAGLGGSVYRNVIGVQEGWDDVDMMDPANGAVGCNAPHPVGQFGLVVAFQGEALYSAHQVFDPQDEDSTSGVCRTIDDGTGNYGPLSGMPKPGIAWDCLIVGLDPGVSFTLEPSSLKLCGCCEPDTDITLYAIDNAVYSTAEDCDVDTTGEGLIWTFTDCLAKKGPALVTEDNTLIGCDPVSGRAQEVNLCWEQLCVADAYDVEIAKNPDFSILVIDITGEDVCWGVVPVDVTSPCVFFPAGGEASGWTLLISGEEEKKSTVSTLGEGSAIARYGNLECGHTYYWRVKVRECATGQWARSPWSEVRSFTVKAGLPVTTPYYGPQLLAPDNGCLGCPVKPASFSWSPFKETTKYKFVLAKDAEMTQIVTEAEVSGTAFEYDGTLDYSTNYFWRVMALEPAPSDWSATFSFQTEAAPPPPVEPPPPAATPLWVWVVIAIGAILVIVTLVLIFKTRRV